MHDAEASASGLVLSLGADFEDGTSTSSVTAADSATTCYQCKRQNGREDRPMRHGSTRSTRSLTRQKRISSSLEYDQQASPKIDSSASSSAMSLPGIGTRDTTPMTATPIGDIPNGSIERTRGSVFRRAAKFLSERSGSSGTRGFSVGRTIQRTGSQLRKTRLFHLFYFFVLPFYTVIGALIFQALDGEYDDRLALEFENRCRYGRESQLHLIERRCSNESTSECFARMRAFLDEVEGCYRRWHTVNRTLTHSMNDFTNALVYAFSVYTTIGYGNMAADTLKCRIATIIYGALGIPLFFAFVKEEGNLFRNIFIASYNKLRKWKRRNCRCPYSANSAVEIEPLQLNSADERQRVCIIGNDVERGDQIENDSKRARFSRKISSTSLLDEQRRVFAAGVLVFIFYILLCSLVFSLTTEFDYFTSVYFLFNSVALIGFGDVFPKEPRSILLNAMLIVFGVVLFSMCYFILQEEIRNKAFEASRRARISISKYSHTIMQHATRTAWSRRNSPLMDDGPDTSAFERLRKRRQSAPALTLTVPGSEKDSPITSHEA